MSFMLIVILLWMLMKNSNPLKMAIVLIIISLLGAMNIFSNTLTNWLSLVVILMFSSGMMVLFIYIASLSANEKNKQKFFLSSWAIMFILPLSYTSESSLTSMKVFSSHFLILSTAFILILAMFLISSNSNHLHQNLNTSI